MTNHTTNQHKTLKGKLKRRVPFKLHRSAIKKINIKQIILTCREANTNTNESKNVRQTHKNIEHDIFIPLSCAPTKDRITPTIHSR